MPDLPPRGVPPKMSDERAFYKLARDEYLVPFLNGVLEEIQRSGRGSVEGEIAAVYAFVEWWKRNRDPLFDVRKVADWANGINIRHAKAFEADIKRLGSGMPNPYWKPSVASTRDVLENTIMDSVSLIKTIPERFHEVLSTRLIQAEREALLDLDARRALFKEHYGKLTAEERAKVFRGTSKQAAYILRRITRDQANKLSGSLNIHRLREAGFRQYTWSTVGDERVRPDHAPRDGHKFDVHTGTGIPRDMHPGEAVQCRCVAVAYVPPKTM